MEISDLATGIQHIGVPTNDIEKTIGFYNGLGFETVHRAVNPANGEKIAFLRLKTLVIETYENHQAAGVDGAIAHFALDVTDVEAVFNRIRDAGYEMIDREIRFLPLWEKGFRYFNIRGVNREIIEFGQIL